MKFRIKILLMILLVVINADVIAFNTSYPTVTIEDNCNSEVEIEIKEWCFFVKKEIKEYCPIFDKELNGIVLPYRKIKIIISDSYEANAFAVDDSIYFNRTQITRL